MAQSDLNVSNLALRLIGNRAVLTALTDTSTEGLACAELVDHCKKALLRMHPWNFALKRKIITPPSTTTLSTPFVEFVSTDILKFTVASHSYVAGDYLISASSGVSEATGPFEVTGTTATTVTVSAPGVTAITGIPAAGTIRICPAFEYSYLYSLPSDCLRFRIVNENCENSIWRIEGRKILTNEGTSLRIQYVYDVTDYTTMDPAFYQSLANYLAYNLCDHISASDGKKNEIHAYLYGGQGKRGILSQAKFLDATEDSQQQFEATEWIDARFNGPSTGPTGDPIA